MGPSWLVTGSECYQLTHESFLVVSLPILFAKQFSTHWGNLPGCICLICPKCVHLGSSCSLKWWNFNLLQEFDHPLRHMWTHVILHECVGTHKWHVKAGTRCTMKMLHTLHASYKHIFWKCASVWMGVWTRHTVAATVYGELNFVCFCTNKKGILCVVWTCFYI